MRDLIAEALESARKKGIDLSNKTKICVSLDVNGPLTATDSAALELYPGIREAIRELKELGIYIIINSAWDLETLRIFDKKRLGGVADGIIGENGAVYALKDNETVFMSNTDLEQHRLDLFIAVLKTCSKNDISFASQGNQFNVSYYHEFERGLARNICRENIARPKMNNFLKTLKQYGIDSGIRRKEIVIDESKENYKKLQLIFDKSYRLISFRPNVDNGHITLEIDDYRDRNISLRDLYQLAKEVADNLRSWDHFRVNDDYCIDYFLSTNILDKEINKASALDTLIEDLCTRESFERENLLIMCVGDGEPDTCLKILKDSIFIGINGTKSEECCDMAASGGLEFLQIVKMINGLLEK